MKTRETPGKATINILAPRIVGALLRRTHFRNAVHPVIEHRDVFVESVICMGHKEAVIEKPYNPSGHFYSGAFSHDDELFDSVRGAVQVQCQS